MILLDANVLMYALGRPSPLRDPCRDILAAASAPSASVINADVEALQEILHVADRRGDRARGVAAVRSLREMFHEPVVLTGPDIDRAAALMDEYPCLSARDAIHAAVALNHEADAFVSADKAFQDIRELPWTDPIEFAKRLGGEARLGGDAT